MVPFFKEFSTLQKYIAQKKNYEKVTGSNTGSPGFIYFTSNSDYLVLFY